MRLKPRLLNAKLTRVFDVEIMQYEINKNSQEQRYATSSYVCLTVHLSF